MCILFYYLDGFRENMITPIQATFILGEKSELKYAKFV